MKFISSLQNSLVKEMIALQAKSRLRKEKGLFVCEGLNEIRLCNAAGFEIKEILFCAKNIEINELISELKIDKNPDFFTEVNSEVFAKLAYRDEVKNAIALVRLKELKLNDLSTTKNPLYLVAERVEKPGNLGALLRSADAAGVTAVLLADPLCDLFNPNVIRGSVGCVFTVPVISASTKDIQEFLKLQGASVFTTFMENAHSAWDCDFHNATALVVGTESTGLSDAWNKPEYRNVNIPMFGKVDSLNVSVAAALLLFEAKRQRVG